MRLIDADALMCAVMAQDVVDKSVVKRLIIQAPTVDAVQEGRWEKVRGYFTPGGDPVWQCSECGKGLHVYGIEAGTYGSDVADHQWVACPNCGARMDVERETNDE